MFGNNSTIDGIFDDFSSSTANTCFFLDPLNVHRKWLNLVTSFINIICSIIAVTGNGILILAFWKSNHLRSQSHLLLWCLTFADFITGLIVQPMYSIHKIAHVLGNLRLSCVFRVVMETVAWVSVAVSCGTFAAIAGERFLALHFHLGYNDVVTPKKVVIFIVQAWVSTIALSVSRFAINHSKPFLIVNIIGIIVSLLVLLVAYWKIFGLVQRHHRQIQDQSAVLPDKNLLDFKRYKKSVINMGAIAALYATVYAPFTCVLLGQTALGFTTEIETAYDITRTLAFMTSSWNPFLYCWKLSDLKQAVRSVLKKESNEMGTISEMTG